MNNSFPRIPFLRLLIPAVCAILAATFTTDIIEPVPIFGVGTTIVVISYLIPHRYDFGMRWLFGFGISWVIFAIFTYQTQQKIRYAAFDFTKERTNYIAFIDNIPQEKERSYACDLTIVYPANKKVVAYFQKDENAARLQPGEEILLHIAVEPFQNFGNPDDFDYVRYMRNRGFSGSAYLPTQEWKRTGKTHNSLRIQALRMRQKVNTFYREFELPPDEQAFISALTLGHKQDLTNELKEAFRASGTAHVLAVSGLHVGIIYAAFAFLFSILPNKRRTLAARQVLIIIALWAYAMLTGLSPSVTRATIMLTIVSAGILYNKKGFTYNTLITTAFLLLAVNPLYLFDVGFQMSFGAVLSILFFNPKITRLYEPKHKAGKYIWSLFTVSTSAQLGVFPVALYYFGTFPTYFFIANIVVVPMIGLVIYAILPTALAVIFKKSGFLISAYLFTFFRWILRFLINMVLHAVYLIESLPFAQFSEWYISIPQMFILIILAITFAIFLKQKKAHQLLTLLTGLLLFILTIIGKTIKSENPQFVVYNTPNISDYGFFSNNKRIYPDLNTNSFVPARDKRILILSDNILSNFETENKMRLDALILSEDKTFSIDQLNQLFQTKTIVLDNSISPSMKRKWIADCKRLDIPVHDVAQNGAFIVNL